MRFQGCVHNRFSSKTEVLAKLNSLTSPRDVAGEDDHIIDISRYSAASLYLDLRFGDTTLASGTGFVIRYGGSPFLVTAGHCLTGRHPHTGQPLSTHAGIPDNIRILHNAVGEPGAHTVTVEPLLAAGEPRYFLHARGVEVDVAVLPVTETDGVELLDVYDPADPGPPIAFGPASSLSVIGFPFGYTSGGGLPVWMSATVASEPALGYEGWPMFLVDARTRTGQSGSPALLYSRGGTVTMQDGRIAIVSGEIARFLGVYTGRIDERTDIGVVWKPEVILEILAGAAPSTAI